MIRLELSPNSKRKPYSDGERELFQLLPKNGKRISSAQLMIMKKRRSATWLVKHPRNNVTVTMKHLIAKVRHNRESFVVHQSKRVGPHPIEYWIEVRHPTDAGATRS